MFKTLIAATVLMLALTQLSSAQTVQLKFQTVQFDGMNLNCTYEVTVPLNSLPQTYTVEVPYSEQIEKDGKIITVQKTRTENRTRMTPGRIGIEQRTRVSEGLGRMVFKGLDGVEIQEEEVKQLIANPKRVLFLEPDAQLNDVHREILHPDTIVMMKRVEE